MRLRRMKGAKMRLSRVSKEQIIGVLKELEAGLSVGEAARKHGVREPHKLKILPQN